MKNLYITPRQILVCFVQSIHISVPWPFAKSWEEEKKVGEREGKKLEAETAKANPLSGIQARSY
jgi:hypothetical protein